MPWGFPAWLGQGNAKQRQGTALSKPSAKDGVPGGDTADYIVAWVGCAAKHNLTIDVLGVWNEMDNAFAADGVAYLKLLRRRLNVAGHKAVKLVAGDVHTWDPASKVATDAELRSSLYALCRHYPSTLSDRDADESGMPLWSSEDYAADNSADGGRCAARIINQNFVHGNMSATIMWNLLSAYYGWLQWSNDGLMLARTPWSGAYTVRPPIWAMAHTEQFVSVGARLLPQTVPGGSVADNATCGSGYLRHGGTFVSYWEVPSPASGDGGRAVNAANLTIVIEKIAPKQSGCGFSSTPLYSVHDENVEFQIDANTLNELGATASAPLTLALWRSNFSAVDDHGSYFNQEADVTVSADGRFSVDVGVDAVITLSTRRGQRKGTNLAPAPPPSESRFPLMFAESFDGLPIGHEAPLLAQMSGAFEVVQSADTSRGRVLAQTGVGYPVIWLRNDVLPYTQVGDAQWSAVNATVELAIPSPSRHTVSDASSGAVSGANGGAGFLAVRLDGRTTDATGIFFGIDNDDNSWFLAPSLASLAARNRSLYMAHGVLPPARAGGGAMIWRALGLNVSASGLASGTIDRVTIFSAVDVASKAPARGSVGIGTGQYSRGYFDRLSLSAAAASPPPPPRPKPLPPPDPPKNGTCDKVSTGSPVFVRGCQSDPKAPSQAWVFHPDGTIGLAAPPLAHLCLTPTRKASGCSGVCIEMAPCATAPSWRRGSSATGKAKLVLVHTATIEVGSVARTDVCLEIDAAPSSPIRVDTYACNNHFHGGDNERWDYDQATGIVSSRLFGSETSCMMAC